MTLALHGAQRSWAWAVATAAREAREQAGLTRTELALKMGGSRDQVGRVESTAMETRLSALAPYAHALDLSLWELIEAAERLLV